MRVTPPLWLNPPEVKRIPCRVEGKIEPNGYMVQINLDGEQRSIGVPEKAVRVNGTLPADGNLLVVVVAELPDDNRLLTELPATPLSGSRRIKVDPKRLQVA